MDASSKRDRDTDNAQASSDAAPAAQRGPQTEAGDGTPTAAPAKADNGPTIVAVPARTTRKGERFADPKSVSIYFRDFTLDTVVDRAPPPADAVDDTARVAPVGEDHVTRQAQSWEQHYQHNKGLYPIKNYIAQAFPTVFLAWEASDAKAAEAGTDLDAQAPRTIIECGCGVGSALLPLAGLLPRDRFVGFDVSKSAVDLMLRHERTVASAGRISGFPLDIAAEALPAEHNGTADAVLLVFVLSAVGKSQQQVSLERLRTVMKPGGMLCFRDYGRYDHNERRFYDGGNKVADGGYVKGDGTQQCFFELEATRELFRRAGFVEAVPLDYHFNRVHNRKTDVEMRKVFINGVFTPAPAKDAAADSA